MGVVRESRKFFGHCAVIFAIAQLSCVYMALSRCQVPDSNSNIFAVGF